jgi:hypothetical protein
LVMTDESAQAAICAKRYLARVGLA